MPNLARAAWLQSMLIHRYTTDKQGRALYEAACEVSKTPYDRAHFDDFVHDASTAVGSFGLEVRRMPDPWTGRGMIALVNTKGDEIAQLATNYSPSEINLLKKLIEMIFTSPNESFSTSSTSVLNVVKDLKPTLTKSAAEHFIDTLIHHGWIHKSSQGYLSLSSRALLELQTYLKEQYPDEILTCHECQHIVTRGLSCGSCDVKIHKQCEVFIIGHGNQKQCPECKVNWEPSSIGEENLNSTNASRRRQRARRQRDEDEDNDDGEEEEEAADEHVGSGNDDEEDQVNQLSQDTEVEADDDGQDTRKGSKSRAVAGTSTEEENDEEEEEQIRGSSRRRSGTSIVKRRRPS